MIRLLIFYVCIMLCAKGAFAQFYSSGQSPPNMKWRQIQTAHFKLIFPENYSYQAQYFAHYFEQSYPLVAHSLDGKLKKNAVVVHNQSMMSNGFVSWAPKRVELFPLPTQNMLSSDYKLHLTVHELRHVVQMNKLREGKSKLLTYIFGEQITGALAGIYLPLWFLEGDAVCAETSLSQSGRGRSPLFTNKLKAQLIQKEKYSYDKAVFGSYKDFTPNHYELGYFLTAHARTYYGKNIWGNVLNNVADNPFGLLSFSKGVRKATGLNKSELYNAALDSVKTDWENYTESLSKTKYNVASPKAEDFTDYSRFVLINDSVVVAVKRSFSETEQLVAIDKYGNEKKIRSIGWLDAHTLSAFEENLYVVQRKPDKRWQNRSYANVLRINAHTGKIATLTSKGRYQTSKICPNGNFIASVYVDTQGGHSLHILDAVNGNLIKELDCNGFYLIDPSWADSENVVFVAAGEQGKAIALINTQNNTLQMLTDFSFTEIAGPSVYHDTVYFTSSYSGINNICAFCTKANKIFLLTSSLYSAKDAFWDASREKMYYLNYSANGHEIVFASRDELLWQPINETAVYDDVLLNAIVEQEGNVVHGFSKPDSLFAVKKYRPIFHIFNPHSWAPLYIDVDRNSIDPGAVLFSQNLLSTAIATVGYKHNVQENTGSYMASFEYSGFYPIISSSYQSGKRRIASTDGTDNLWQEKIMSNSMILPFIFTKGQYFTRINVFAQNNYINYLPLENKDLYENAVINAMDYGVVFSNTRLMAVRDLYPKFAQSLILRYAHAPFSNNNIGELITGRCAFFFPGAFSHNSLFFYATYQKRNPQNFAFSFVYPIARGHNYMEYITNSSVTLQSNYAFPFAYPDLSLAPFLYLKRLKALLFFDYTQSFEKNTFLRSYGLELTADTHILRFVAPVNLGLRGVYNQNRGKIFFEPVFSVNFDVF